MIGTVFDNDQNLGHTSGSKYVREQFDEFKNHQSMTTSSLPEETTKDELKEVFLERLSPDWDGYGAVPLSIGAYTDAKKFIESLPGGCPMPESVPEPSGAIGLEWFRDNENILSIGFHGGGRASYAAFLSGLPRNGTFYLKGKIQKSIAGLLADLFAN